MALNLNWGNQPNPTGFSAMDYLPGGYTAQDPSIAMPVLPAAALGGGAGVPAAPAAGYDPSWWDRLIGYRDPVNNTQTAGWGGLALTGLSTIGNAWMGMKQYDLMKDQLAFQKDAFNKNYANQTQMINTQLEDRQRARVGANPNAYESVASYMDKNRVGR